MMAKKRRRRRADGAEPAPTASTPPPPKTAAAASPGAKQDQQGAEEEEEEGEDNGIALPPLPSELGRDAVMAAQVRTCKYRPILLCCSLACSRCFSLSAPWGRNH